MSESIETSEGFLRGEEFPSRSRGSKDKPKKAKSTTVTLASLRKNVSMGKLPEKIKKYNEEYARLVELARTVNAGRGAAEEKAEGEERNLAYAEVSKTIEAYNAQAAKLAAIGVQVLAFDSGIRRIEKEENKNARAIKVPKFVRKALDALNIAAADKIREGMARQEEAQATLAKDVQAAILTAAEEAIGQDAKTGTVSKAALDSLAYKDASTGEKVLSQTIYDSLRNEVVPEAVDSVEPVAEEVDEEKVGDSPVVSPPQTDISNPDVAAPSVASETQDPVTRAKEAGAAVARMETGKVSNRVVEATEAMREANRIQEAEKRKSELKEVLREFLESSSAFDAFRVVGEKFYLAGDDESKKLRFMSQDGKNVSVSPEELAEAMGLEDIDVAEQNHNYSKFMLVVKANDNWETAIGDDAHKPEIKELFDAVTSSIIEGKSNEEIVESGKPFFDDPQVAEVSLSFCTTDTFKLGLVSLSSFGHKIEKDKDVVVDEPVEKEKTFNVENAEIKARVTDETLRRLANGMRLNRSNGMDPVVIGGDNQPVVDSEQPVVDSEQPVVDSEQPVVDSEQPVVDSEQPVVDSEQPVESQNDNIRRLSEISDEMAALARVKNNLIASGINDPELMAKLDASIRSLTNQMSSLLDSNIVGLGNPSEELQRDVSNENTPVEVGPTAEERHADDIMWWNEMESILDDPIQDELSKMEIARFRRRMAEERAQDNIDRAHFNERREALIEANRANTAILRARREELAAERARVNARDILSYIGRDGERAYSDDFINEIEDPVAFLNELREIAPTEVARAEGRLEAVRNAASVESVNENPVVEQGQDAFERQPGVTRVPVRRVVRPVEVPVELVDETPAIESVQNVVDEPIVESVNENPVVEQGQDTFERQPGVTRVPVRRVVRPVEVPVELVDETPAIEPVQNVVDESIVESVNENPVVEQGQDTFERQPGVTRVPVRRVVRPVEVPVELVDETPAIEPVQNVVDESIVESVNENPTIESDDEFVDIYANDNVGLSNENNYDGSLVEITEEMSKLEEGQSEGLNDNSALDNASEEPLMTSTVPVQNVSVDNQNSAGKVQEDEVVVAPVENIDLVMNLIVDNKNMDHRYDTEEVSHEFFDENPRIRQEYESQYTQAAGPDFWKLVADGFNPVVSTNPAVESVRIARREQAARDFLGFAYSLDDEMLNAMENEGHSALQVVNSLPRKDVERNLELYGRYLESRRKRIEAKR